VLITPSVISSFTSRITAEPPAISLTHSQLANRVRERENEDERGKFLIKRGKTAAIRHQITALL